MNDKSEKKFIGLLEKRKGTIERIERMSDEEKKIWGYVKKDSSDIFREYGLD